MKRLFIAINLPENIKNDIEEIIDSLKISVDRRENLRKSAAEIRFLRRENWHLTISFLGYQPDSAIDLILKSMRETAKDFNAPIIEFAKVILAPAFAQATAGKPSKPPRMIWLTTTKDTSQVLSQIKNNLEDNLIKNGVKFERENRGYNGHITLARFAEQSRITSREFFADIQKKLDKLNPGKIKEISFISQLLDLMESYLNPVRDKFRCNDKSAALHISNGVKRAGAEYKILLSVKI